MESGYVKFFDAREGKLFGFLVDEMGDELWFHWSDGRDFLITVKDEVVMQQSPARLPFPKKGDRLVFLRGRNAKGPKAAAWGFKSAHDQLMEQAKNRQAPKQVTHRHRAGVFDLPVDGPEDVRGDHASRDAIGGYYGIAWFEYFKDAQTGEVYRVRCSDGVYGGNGSYSWEDEQFRQRYYYWLLERFKNAVKASASEIRISRNERALMQGFTHAALLENADGTNGKQSNDGLEGGLVGHYHGIPVICDLELADSMPARETETAKA